VHFAGENLVGKDRRGVSTLTTSSCPDRSVSGVIRASLSQETDGRVKPVKPGHDEMLESPLSAISPSKMHESDSESLGCI
jgi:hypothetical protein